ncbi:WASH complex subunit 2C isoform X1 [Dermacentor silvarum]|uniref:WASH complex subunit 2C isoform X1 n=1 Tax=Dermacentor silvarum TaxID=543639 RepID=UPI002100BD3F|nr:WASH complex subunit 2C isoform X1 [Dermacentor silvarum]
MNSVHDEALATKQWEQPLTTADMRARAAEWSLADDSRLLAYLEVFTESITSRTCGIQKQLEGLIHETLISGVKVQNVINDFGHLSSLQFVENRVYDEEVKAEPRDAQSPSCKAEEEGALLLGQVSEAFRLGVDVLRSSLEVVDLRQDSEDDDDSDEDAHFRHAEETLLRPLDPYLSRPLPPLIGSDQFLRDDHVGLGELLSEEEGDEKSSLGEYDSGKSETDSSSDGTKEPVIDNKMGNYMKQEFGDSPANSDEPDIFTADTEELHSDGSDEDSVTRRDSFKRSSSVKENAELAEDGAKIQNVVDRQQTNNQQSAEEESESPFARKSGLFSGNGKLFDDDDEEGDLFRDVSNSTPPSTSNLPAPTLTQNGKKVPVGGVSILGAMRPPSTSVALTGVPPLSAPWRQGKRAALHGPVASDNLSTHSDEVRSVHFGSLTQGGQATSMEGVMDPKASVDKGVFGNEDDKSASLPPNTSATQKPLDSALFEEEDYSDLWTSTPTRVTSQPTVPTSHLTDPGFEEECPVFLPSEEQSDKSKYVLFDDDEDDLLFSSTSAAAKTESKPPKSLFSDDEEDIFASAKTALTAANSQQTKPHFFGNNTASSKSRTSSRGIFLFEDEDGLLCPAAPVLEKPPDPADSKHPTSAPISLFTTEEDDDLFAVPAHPADSQSSHSASWSMGSKGDAESASVVVPEEPVAKSRRGSCFIFDQEEEIFKSSEDNLDVDLFAPAKPTELEKPPAGGVPLFGGSSLFGGELRSRLGKASMPKGGEPDASLAAAIADPPSRLRDTKVVSASFDEPADKNKTLISATKSRAKVKAKRRLPSRRKLQADSRSSDGDSKSPPADGRMFPSSHAPAALVTHSRSNAEAAIDPASSKPALMVVKSPSTEEEDLFAVNSLQPVPAEARHKPCQAVPSVATAAGSQAPFSESILDDDRVDDLFAVSAESSHRRVTSRHEQSSSDAIFGAGDTVPHWSENCMSSNTAANWDAQAPPQETPKKASNSIFDDNDDDDDDIFASKPGKSGTSALSSQAKRNTLFSDDTDDIFSSKPATVSTMEKKGSQPATRKSLPRTTNFKDPLLGDISD